MNMDDTWDKTIRIGNKRVKKKDIRSYYKRLWERDPTFRKNLRKNGLFVRAVYNGRPTIVRKGIKVKDWDDVEDLIKNHTVEFHLPTKKYSYPSYIDIDMPPKYIPKKSQIARSIIGKLKRKNVNVALVVDSPSGVHIFSKTKKARLRKALEEIEADDKRFAVTKTSKNKIALDPAEPNAAVPGSLSCRGKPYRKWG